VISEAPKVPAPDRGVARRRRPVFSAGVISGIGVIILISISYSLFLSIISIIGFFTGPIFTLMYAIVAIGILLIFGILGILGGAIGGLLRKMKEKSSPPDD
jgi:hypothetical protein